jgi:hypothetical protein
MGVAARAILLPLDALGVQALVLVGEVVAILTGFASEDDFFSRHLLYRSGLLRLTEDCGPTAAGYGLTALLIAD